MLTNRMMVKNRFGRWARARADYARIMETFGMGGIVTISTHLKTWQYTKKHAGMFKVENRRLLVQRGKRWEDVFYCAIRHYRPQGAA